MRDLIKALVSLYPNAKWSLNGEEYSKLQWLSSEIPKPTEQELFEECDRLQAEYEAKQYQRDRAAEYPSYADQFDTIFHEGLDVWKAQIQAIKDKYPKS